MDREAFTVARDLARQFRRDGRKQTSHVVGKRSTRLTEPLVFRGTPATRHRKIKPGVMPICRGQRLYAKVGRIVLIALGDWKCIVWLSSGPDYFRLLEL